MKTIKHTITAAICTLMVVSCGTQPTNLSVMSFNIRYDNPEDGENNWQYRKDVAAKVVTDNDIDIVGMQEVLHNQLLDLAERLPEYSYVGVGREDGFIEGEYSPIFYNNTRFTELSSGYFWLSENPESVGEKGWDAACERIATWIVLKEAESGKELFVLNTHFDHVGEVARRESVKLLTDRTAEFAAGRPVIITGDFNAEPEDEVVVNMIGDDNAIVLYSSRDHADKITKEAVGTFHDFGNIPDEMRPYIDYIFVGNGVNVKSYGVLDDKLDGVYLSDHIPVMAIVEIK